MYKHLNSKFSLIAVILFICLSCDSDKAKQEQLNRFKDYIVGIQQAPISITQTIKIDLKKPIEKFQVGKKLPADIMEISPKTAGNLIATSSHTLVFEPVEKLMPASTYELSLSLDDLYKKVPRQLNTFDFEVKTIQPQIKVTTSSLQSSEKNKMSLDAQIQLSDITQFAQVKKVIKAEQDDDRLNINWGEHPQEADYFTFSIKGIKRFEKPAKLNIKWDGEPIESEDKGNFYVDIPAIESFEVLSLKYDEANANQISLNFSDALATDQNLNGLISINGRTDLSYEVKGNTLMLFPEKRLAQKVSVSVDQSVKNEKGETLDKAYDGQLIIEKIKPGVKLVSKGSILPGSSQNPFYFKAVNLKAVDVKVIKIYQGNILQYLQNHDLGDAKNYQIRKYGRIVARKTIPLITDEIDDDNTWKAYAVDLTELFKTEPGAIYNVELSFRPSLSLYGCDTGKTNYSYEPIKKLNMVKQQEEDFFDYKTNRRLNYSYNWQERENPCHPAYYNPRKFVASNLLASNIGLTAKRFKSEMFIAARDLINLEKMGDLNLSFYNYQQQKIGETQTNSNGFATFKVDKHAAFLIAENDNEFAYLNLDENKALSLSNFDVSGKEVKQGLDGFIYTERGVYRPGDTIHTGFVLNDLENPLPKDHPVKVKLKDARGKLVYQETKNQGLNGFYRFDLPTDEEAPTGNWMAEVIIGGLKFEKNIKVASIKPNRLKIDLDFKEDVIAPKDDIRFRLSSKWLSGATAKSLKAKVDLKLFKSKNPFSDHEGYIFENPVLQLNRYEKNIFDGQLNQQGFADITEDFEIKRSAPGMLKLSFLTKVFENGGDFSIDVQSKKYAPYNYFVGVKKPKKQRPNYYTGKEVFFRLKSLDYKGDNAPNRDLKVSVYKIGWHWWWNRGDDNLSRYRYASNRDLIKTLNVQTDAKGDGSFTLNINNENSGRFFVKVEDKAGHSTGFITYFFRNWWNNKAGNVSKMLVFSADKEKYSIGDNAKITFPSDKNARALVTVENGAQILEKKWVNTKQGSTTTSIPVTKPMAPNAYVSISLLQKHQNTTNDRPMRLFGVLPIEVSNQNAILKPQIKAPQKIKPESDYSIEISEEQGRAMTYTLAVVDRGLLDLTNYKTPDIYKHFYSKKALGVETFDVYDDVIGAFSGTVNNIFSIGGGDEALGSKNKKANRFKPVVDFIGPFQLAKGEKRTHQLHMGNYIGAVKASVVAGQVNNRKFGKAEQEIAVKKPLMLLASAPRKFSPGETVKIPVTVFSLDESIKNVKVTAGLSDGLRLMDEGTKRLSFDKTGEKIVDFEIEVMDTKSLKKISFTATSAKENAKYELELDSYNPNPVTQKTTSFIVQAKASTEKEITSYGQAGTREAYVELSSFPAIDINRRLDQLIRYPHGCTEQTTSAAFPQIYLDDILDLPQAEQQEIRTNVQDAIKKLGHMQRIEGGIPYWRFGQSNEWCTSYVGHFMLEARNKGFTLPISFLSNWINYQQRKARTWRDEPGYRYDEITQAYRLYTLALAGKPDLAAMNKLKQNSKLPTLAKWRLALGYAIIGQESPAREIIKTASVQTDHKNHYRTFGSSFRNQAMLLESMVFLEDDRVDDVAKDIAGKLSSDNWLNTQETAFALVAMAKVIKQNNGKNLNFDITVNGTTSAIQSEKSIYKLPADQPLSQDIKMKINNKKEGKLYARLVQSGKQGLEALPKEESNLGISTTYSDANGQALPIKKLRQGTPINLNISVENTSNTNLKNVALSYFIPSGWENIDTSFTEYSADQFPQADHVDVRDNVVRFYFDLKVNDTKSFNLKLNSSYLGRFYLPASQVESMYDHRFYARSRAFWIEVYK